MSSSHGMRLSKKKIRALIVGALALIGLVTALITGQLPPGLTSTQGFETARVLRVVDGDTLIVEVSGAEKRLRLIGVDAAESVHPDSSKNTTAGSTASDFTKSLVSPNQTIYLQKDTSETDRYDRLLRYVWLKEPENRYNLDEVRTKMLNGILVAEGYAQPKRYEPDTAYADIFESLSG